MLFINLGSGGGGGGVNEQLRRKQTSTLIKCYLTGRGKPRGIKPTCGV